MRRPLVATLLAAMAVGMAAAPASTQAPSGLRLVERGAFLYFPYEGDQDRVKAFAVRPGEQYRFQVDYSVRGARRVGTGHVFAFENVLSGERVRVDSKSFPPDPPGDYNEAVTFNVPADWTPGVYRFSWRLSARHPRLESTEITGARSFLVLPA